LFEPGAAACAKTTARASRQAEPRMTQMEAKLKRKDEVIAELIAEPIPLKKRLGES